MTPPRRSEHGLPIGEAVDYVVPRPFPKHGPFIGQYCRLDALTEDHAQDLFEAMAEDQDGRGWTYMPIEPWISAQDAVAFCAQNAQSKDPLFYHITTLEGRSLGFCTFLRITPMQGSIEVGYIRYTPRLQRTSAATEAMYLLMRHVFEDLGYRRYEWKCDALNAPSCAAAERLGFTFEGIFRQAAYLKGRNRDTAWYSIIDKEWPALQAAFERWLSPDNFDADGQQIHRLQDLRDG